MALRTFLGPLFGFTLLLVAATIAMADSAELNLWPNGIPGEADEPGQTKMQPGDDGVLRVAYVGNPTITLYRAPEETANGCAVVICPGGGYGLRRSANPVCTWPHRCAEWMRSSGLLNP